MTDRFGDKVALTLIDQLLVSEYSLMEGVFGGLIVLLCEGESLGVCMPGIPGGHLVLDQPGALGLSLLDLQPH